MSDHELLELAAKAAGINIKRSRLDDKLVADMLIDVGDAAPQKYIRWNPLADDSDALHLAVLCGLVIDTSRPSAGEPFKQHHFAQSGFVDRHVGVRRSIVRAAADIGKNMK